MDYIDPATLTGSEFAKYLGKTAVISFTATSGVLTGMITVGYFVGRHQDRKLRKTKTTDTPAEAKN